jgi:hypothetical protein
MQSLVPTKNRSRGNLLREWYALQLQKRRRHATSGPTPNAPTITNGVYGLNGVDSSWFDTFLEFNWSDVNFPAASLELWLSVGGEAFYLVDTVPSDTPDYSHVHVTDGENVLLYQMRYVGDTVTGPFSLPYEIDLSY